MWRLLPKPTFEFLIENLNASLWKKSPIYDPDTSTLVLDAFSSRLKFKVETGWPKVWGFEVLPLRNTTLPVALNVETPPLSEYDCVIAILDKSLSVWNTTLWVFTSSPSITPGTKLLIEYST